MSRLAAYFVGGLITALAIDYAAPIGAAPSMAKQPAYAQPLADIQTKKADRLAPVSIPGAGESRVFYASDPTAAVTTVAKQRELAAPVSREAGRTDQGAGNPSSAPTAQGLREPAKRPPRLVGCETLVSPLATPKQPQTPARCLS